MMLTADEVALMLKAFSYAADHGECIGRGGARAGRVRACADSRLRDARLAGTPGRGGDNTEGRRRVLWD